jgi:sorbitol-specific phosphotransferase system component IIBC
LGVNDILNVTPLWAMMLEDEDIDAVVNLSGEKPVIIDCVKVARVTLPVRRAVLTPTILETELGFLMKLIVNKIYCTDLVVARVIVATFEAKEQLDIVTPVV